MQGSVPYVSTMPYVRNDKRIPDGEAVEIQTVENLDVMSLQSPPSTSTPSNQMTNYLSSISQPDFHLPVSPSDSYFPTSSKRSLIWMSGATRSNYNCTAVAKMEFNQGVYETMSPSNAIENKRRRCSTVDTAFKTTESSTTEDDSDEVPEEQWRMRSVMNKRRTRRESHNAVERRRRNTINDNIQRLGRLLPESLSQGKTNKGTILKSSVDYIHILQNQLAQCKERLEALEKEAMSFHMLATATCSPFVTPYHSGKAKPERTDILSDHADDRQQQVHAAQESNIYIAGEDSPPNRSSSPLRPTKSPHDDIWAAVRNHLTSLEDKSPNHWSGYHENNPKPVNNTTVWKTKEDPRYSDDDEEPHQMAPIEQGIITLRPKLNERWIMQQEGYITWAISSHLRKQAKAIQMNCNLYQGNMMITPVFHGIPLSIGTVTWTPPDFLSPAPNYHLRLWSQPSGAGLLDHTSDQFSIVLRPEDAFMFSERNQSGVSTENNYGAQNNSQAMLPASPRHVDTTRRGKEEVSETKQTGNPTGIYALFPSKGTKNYFSLVFNFGVIFLTLTM